MGCGASSGAVLVRPMRPPSCSEDEETGSKHGGRGDSAVSKVTTDSGVVMEAGRGPAPLLSPAGGGGGGGGALPRKLPPLTVAGGVSALQGPAPPEAGPLERPASSQILEQLQSQGIIPADLPRESSAVSGEAYGIMLEDGEVAGRRRLPARLESLKASREQSPHGDDPVVGGRKSLEDPHLHPPPPPPPPHPHARGRASARGQPEGRERGAREAASDRVDGEDRAETREGGGDGGGDRGGDGTEGVQGVAGGQLREEEKEDEGSQAGIEELKGLETLDAELQTVESDDTFQHAERYDDEIF